MGVSITPLTWDGIPMQAPWTYHAELSTLIGMSEIARATGDEALHNEARAIFERTWKALNDPYGFAGSPPEPVAPAWQQHDHHQRPSAALRLSRGTAGPGEDSGVCIDIMRRCHYRSEQKLLLEYTTWDGADIDESLVAGSTPGT